MAQEGGRENFSCRGNQRRREAEDLTSLLCRMICPYENIVLVLLLFSFKNKRPFLELSARTELCLWKFLDVERKRRGGEHGLGLSSRPVSALGKQPTCRHILIHPSPPPHPMSPCPLAGSVLSDLHVHVHTASAELW